MELSNKFDVVLIGFGGGTSVGQSLLLNQKERRMIVSVDFRRMNKVVWVDKVNMLACVQAGMTGVEMDAALKKLGVTVGHEPVTLNMLTIFRTLTSFQQLEAGFRQGQAE